MKKILIICILPIFFSCVNKEEFASKSMKQQNDNYSQYKGKFPSQLTSHFPTKIVDENSFLICNTNVKRNDLSLYLVINDLSIESIKQIVEDTNKKVKEVYSVNDSCLLKVNSFDTIQLKESQKQAEANDKITDKDCFKSKLPIPNFIDYDYELNQNIWNSSEFSFYVLEAKSVNSFKQYNLKPNSQMPSNWTNGFSKGIAIDLKSKKVIYWLNIW